MKTRSKKFRLWDKENKKMIYPNLKNNEFIVDMQGRVYKYKDGKYKNVSKDFVIMDFTGLHDKDLNEIYEGDILKDEKTGMVGVVEYRHRSYVALCNYETYIPYDIFLGGLGNIKKVGNIYENEE